MSANNTIITIKNFVLKEYVHTFIITQVQHFPFSYTVLPVFVTHASLSLIEIIREGLKCVCQVCEMYFHVKTKLL